jgi:ubiquitin-conjugating enzyme E2 variant
MMNALLTTLAVAAQLFAALLVADLLSGLLHWAEDTWLAPGRHPLLDRWIVLPNIEHHERPGAIREAGYWSLNCVCIALAGAAALVLIACGVTDWWPYVTLALASQSNQIHAWGHTARPPRFVALLQRAGVLQSARQHAVHHRRPYGSRYCTTTPWLNPLLDGTGFWRGLERIGEVLGGRVVRASELRYGY